ncbi:ISAfe5, transposase OrfA [Yersinia pseudotuberculosis]|uniref:ISAfe5, transposase OrfA n=1 Tax=Yersinia pseudotuberculosis TaxID=633 RepID=A0A380Q7P9_YERPU|nr:ISAfe5, transposase OrfA [Yersinia pseudotuberculosis]
MKRISPERKASVMAKLLPPLKMGGLPYLLLFYSHKIVFHRCQDLLVIFFAKHNFSLWQDSVLLHANRLMKPYNLVGHKMVPDIGD